jgi:hypothetical protein
MVMHSLLLPLELEHKGEDIISWRVDDWMGKMETLQPKQEIRRRTKLLIIAYAIIVFIIVFILIILMSTISFF